MYEIWFSKTNFKAISFSSLQSIAPSIPPKWLIILFIWSRTLCCIALNGHLYFRVFGGTQNRKNIGIQTPPVVLI
jgi:hypothetical protein